MGRVLVNARDFVVFHMVCGIEVQVDTARYGFELHLSLCVVCFAKALRKN